MTAELIPYIIAVTGAIFLASAIYCMAARKADLGVLRKEKLEQYKDFAASLNGSVLDENMPEGQRIKFATTLTALPTLLVTIYFHINQKSLVDDFVDDRGSFMGFLVIGIVLIYASLYLAIIPPASACILRKFKSYSLIKLLMMCLFVAIPFAMLFFSAFIIYETITRGGQIDAEGAQSFIISMSLVSVVFSAFFLSPFIILWHFLAKNTKPMKLMP